MKIRTLLACLLALLPGLATSQALAGEPTSQHGFLVFSNSGVLNYSFDPKGTLRLEGKASPARIDEFTSTGGHLYKIKFVLSSIYELGADLKPLREVAVKCEADIPHWLGVWDGGLLVFCDNAVAYLDASLKEIARLPLKTGNYDQTTPLLKATDFDVWEHLGYILTNTGEVFVIPLAEPASVEPLNAMLHTDEGTSPDGQWIDPDDWTLNLIATHKKKYNAEITREGGVIDNHRVTEQVVLTYDLKNLHAPASRTIVYKKRELFDINGCIGAEGMKFNCSPYRPDGVAKGTYIVKISRTTPAYAEVVEDKDRLSLMSYEVVRLKSRGRYDVVLWQKTKETPLWFLSEEGRHYAERDPEDHILRLQPEFYQKLMELPELRGIYFKALAY